jgi:hypothetical protein
MLITVKGLKDYLRGVIGIGFKINDDDLADMLLKAEEALLTIWEDESGEKMVEVGNVNEVTQLIRHGSKREASTIVYGDCLSSRK